MRVEPRCLGGNGKAGLGNVTGASTATDAGTSSANPFVGGAPNTYIPNTTSGAEIYGVGDGTLNQASLAAAMGGALPILGNNGVPLSQAGAGLFRVHVGPGTYAN